MEDLLPSSAILVCSNWRKRNRNSRYPRGKIWGLWATENTTNKWRQGACPTPLLCLLLLLLLLLLHRGEGSVRVADPYRFPKKIRRKLPQGPNLNEGPLGSHGGRTIHRPALLALLTPTHWRRRRASSRKRACVSIAGNPGAPL